MIKISRTIPKEITVAVSGGADSMAVLDFLRRGNRDVLVVHVDHNTEFGVESRKLVEEYCLEHELSLKIHKIEVSPVSGMSLEEFWRDERYKVFSKCSGEVITAHHADDSLEWWFMTAAHGIPRLIPYRNGNVIRPFLLTTHEDFLSWCERHNVPFLKDPGNKDPKYMRSLVRTEIIPLMKVVNPGLIKMIRKKYIKLDKQQACGIV
jgi:tRNA(Ile)-lysidine synthase